MSESDLAIVAALVFAWGMVSARLERFDVTAPIIFVVAGALLTHGPLRPLGFVPPPELGAALAPTDAALGDHRRGGGERRGLAGQAGTPARLGG